MNKKTDQPAFLSTDVELKRVAGGLLLAGVSALVVMYGAVKVNEYALQKIEAEVHRQLDQIRQDIRELRQTKKDK